MKQKKVEVARRLRELNKVSFVKPTAMELRSSRPMLARVERQEQRRYLEAVNKQKAKLKLDLQKVDKYLESVKAKQDYLMRAPVVLPKPVSIPPIVNGDGILTSNELLEQDFFKQQQAYLDSINRRESYLGSTPSLIAQPNIVMRPRPMMRHTRLPRYEQRHKRRGRY